ncbi:unnamed protein product [Trifolium pratense]|uniref:Uncharacterized protein n=1 Tax=Trifolium pratense TaxID=57577 RepID=A0ACB0IDQ0_TRIPR|nr:unnamed protein product [Trifolium pratense]
MKARRQSSGSSKSWEEIIYWTHFQFIHFIQFLSTCGCSKTGKVRVPDAMPSPLLTSLTSTPSLQLAILYTTTQIPPPYHRHLHLLRKPPTTSPPNTLSPLHLTPILVLIFIYNRTTFSFYISLTNTTTPVSPPAITTIQCHIIT